MSQRYSKAGKGKWVTSSTRPPVKIPPSDNTHLIEANKKTLIGRVTNPAIQKPVHVIDWLIQYWNLEGRVTGRSLGPELFQFRFEAEEDLLFVLRRGPYHYKRWMVMLQRWEPIVSNSFPNKIPFWIRIHGLPLHYWTKTTVKAIGNELGSFLDDDVGNRRVRVRVHVNGLENLEMRLPLQVPSGEVISVDLEYEKLEKHCFLCFSLRHEKDNCLLNREKVKIASPPRGISQQNTLRSLEDYKQRRDRRHHDMGSKDSSRNKVSGVHCSHRQVSPQSQHSSQYIPHSSNEERRPSNSVQRSQRSRRRPPKSQRDHMRDRRPVVERLEAPPSAVQVETTIELERALALLGFVDTPDEVCS